MAKSLGLLKRANQQPEWHLLWRGKCEASAGRRNWDHAPSSHPPWWRPLLLMLTPEFSHPLWWSSSYQPLPASHAQSQVLPPALMEHLPTLLSPRLTHHTLPDGESSHPQSQTWTHSLSMKFSSGESKFKGVMLDNYLNLTTTLASSPFPQQETSTSQPHPVQCAPPLLPQPPRADWAE